MWGNLFLWSLSVHINVLTWFSSFLPFNWLLTYKELLNLSRILIVFTTSVVQWRVSYDESQLAKTMRPRQEGLMRKKNTLIIFPLDLCFNRHVFSFSFQKFPFELHTHKEFTLSFISLLQSHDKKMGAANDYHTPNLQLAKEWSCLITSYNVQQLVLQALRYIMLHWEGDSVG